MQGELRTWTKDRDSPTKQRDVALRYSPYFRPVFYLETYFCGSLVKLSLQALLQK